MNRTIATTTLFALIAGFTLVFTASPASACSCLGSDPETLMDRSEAVFVGTPTEVFDARGDIANPDVAIIAVDAVYKGDVLERQAVATPARGASSCSVNFVVGTHVTVFASTESADFDLGEGILRSGLCGVSTEQIDFAESPQLPNLGETDIVVIQDQLGEIRPSLLPEALIFVGVLVGVLGLATAFTVRDRCRAAA